MKFIFFTFIIFSFNAFSAEKTKTSNSATKSSVTTTPASSEEMSHASNAMYLHVIPYHSDVGLGAMFEHMTSENVGGSVEG
ncbi:MAG: hypothetical protein K2Q26_09780 [Bdellovibrionales bacterium]|nr:hypothetical protein [Bdellovibrionales bacterium]